MLTIRTAYVDSNLVGSGKVAEAAILGLAGGVWASSAGFTVRLVSPDTATFSFSLQNSPMRVGCADLAR